MALTFQIFSVLDSPFETLKKRTRFGLIYYRKVKSQKRFYLKVIPFPSSLKQSK